MYQGCLKLKQLEGKYFKMKFIYLENSSFIKNVTLLYEKEINYFICKNNKLKILTIYLLDL